MSILEKIVSIYAPHTCLGCGYEGSLVCDACSRHIVQPVVCCYRCHAFRPTGRTCSDCRRQTPLISVNSACIYTGIAKDLIWSLKFDRAQAAADIMGRRLAQLYGFAVPEDALIVPVPTAAKRVRKRGYDQAVLIARSFARHSSRQYTPLLSRLGSQEQKGVGREERFQQLDSAFVLRAPKRVPGSRIILIDDIITTGATLEEAAVTLRSGGAKAVAALTFARA